MDTTMNIHQVTKVTIIPEIYNDESRWTRFRFYNEAGIISLEINVFGHREKVCGFVPVETIRTLDHRDPPTKTDEEISQTLQEELAHRA